MTFGHSQKLNTATDSKLGYTTIKGVYGQFSKKYSSDLSWRDFLTKKMWFRVNTNMRGL